MAHWIDGHREACAPASKPCFQLLFEGAHAQLQGRGTEAVALMRQGLALAEADVGGLSSGRSSDDLVDALDSLSNCLSQLGFVDEAHARSGCGTWRPAR